MTGMFYSITAMVTNSHLLGRMILQVDPTNDSSFVQSMLMWLSSHISTQPLKVISWRALMALPEDAAASTLDSWGIKRLFSHVLRRWLTGAMAPRVPYLGSTSRCISIYSILLFSQSFL